MDKGKMILAEGVSFSLDCHETGLNNNVLVVGTSGSGKTRSIVIPNLLQATGSYVVSDPKGTLYDRFGGYLEDKGYVVNVLNLIDLSKSCHYNPFAYIHSERDIAKLARILIGDTWSIDPFWDLTAEILLSACIGYLWEERPCELNFKTLQIILSQCRVSENDLSSDFDIIMEALKAEKPDSYSVRQYYKVRTSPAKTLDCIIVSALSKMGILEGKDINDLLGNDEMDLPSIGKVKTAMFVIVSDTDRSLDVLANIFFSQLMNELCLYADRECADNALPIPVRFILDDFATHARIAEFPRMIASLRSRNISCMLMIQAEAQLKKLYSEDYGTIIGNCDTYVYLGGNDVETAQEIAKRCDVPLKRILNMPVGTNWIFRRGQAPINGVNVDINNIEKER